MRCTSITIAFLSHFQDGYKSYSTIESTQMALKESGLWILSTALVVVAVHIPQNISICWGLRNE